MLLFFDQIRLGADPGRGLIWSRGGPLLQRTSSSDWKATATNQMHSSDLEAFGKKCCYFWFHSDVKFLTWFGVVYWTKLFRLIFFQIFNGAKCLIYINCILFVKTVQDCNDTPVPGTRPLGL